ncbi:VWA domain-containing protein [Nocardioides sp. HDW12B]|uniref:vWA domain-containing protein n=1 Tax=Nocardioides sp. HDW12B TaxID=2714939 RepID=UPI001409F818|nr:VWA domain-containing protein [Nocardioides sp. HDW12B]QIK65206.1 VWA domain-containing protein [Nocardioides sp. HDW12B]
MSPTPPATLDVVPPRTPPEVWLLGFTRALRAAGVAVTSDRSQTFLHAVTRVGLGADRGVYWAGRATLCSGPEDLERYDQVFSAWFLADEQEQRGAARENPPAVSQAALDLEEATGEGTESEDAEVAASATEVLRHRDVATLDAAERARLNQLFATLRPRAPTRTSYRRTPARRGTVDTSATLRRTLRQLGEPVDVAWRARSTRARRIVLLVDVSGSMSRYADALLRLSHRIGSVGDTEVFSVGTRVTRLTCAMHLRDGDRALVAAGEAVPDWSGGTRLGEGLRVFLDRWGQRGLVRGAVVVLFSDGWERGDTALLAEQMARLHRLSHRVVWVNPHKGRDGYQPVQQGMVAALPHVDEFVAGHSVAAFEKVLEVVADA